MILKKVSSKKKILLISFVIISVFLLSIKPVHAVATIVGSDYDENSYLRIEMDVYKENDGDPNFDYYFVKVFITDKYSHSDRILDTQFVKIFCYTQGAEKRLSERRPVPGTYYSDQVIQVTLFGVTIPIQIVQGVVTTSYWHATTGATQSFSWTYNTANTRAYHIETDMTYTLGYRVPQGNGLSVSAYAQGTWQIWWWIFIIDDTTKDSPPVAVSV